MSPTQGSLGLSLDCFGRSNPTSKRTIGRRFFGHHRISLRAVAVVAPGIAEVYWAAESHADFQPVRGALSPPEGRGFTALRMTRSKLRASSEVAAVQNSGSGRLSSN